MINSAGKNIFLLLNLNSSCAKLRVLELKPMILNGNRWGRTEDQGEKKVTDTYTELRSSGRSSIVALQ